MFEFANKPASWPLLNTFILILGTLAATFLPLATDNAAAQQQFVTTPLVATTKMGKFTFQIELAVTAEMRATGLMFRREMAPDRGMLFDFMTTRPVMMWMKNTYLPLDMIFIEEGGRIARIAKDTTPQSLAVISSKTAVRYVLELNAGTAARTGMEEGQVLQHALFGNAPGQ